MFEKIIPVLVALIALQFIIRVMHKKRTNPTPSAWKEVDYRKRIDLLMKGREPDGIPRDNKGITLIGIEDFAAIPGDMRSVRRDLLHVREGLSTGLRAKIGRDVSNSKFTDPDKMFDEIVEVVNRHTRTP